MPSARELLAQADALMRRNRARAVDTEFPELTEAVTELVPAPLPTALEEVPELTDAVEEIEIASIAEMPDYDAEPSAWLHFDRGDPSVPGHAPDAVAAGHGPQRIPGPDAKRLGSLIALASNAGESTQAVSPAEPVSPGKSTAAADVPAATPIVAPPAAGMPVQDVLPLYIDLAASGSSRAPRTTADDVPPAHATPEPPEADWARWEALAEEIRMQVLQRIDIFTDTGLRERLGAKLQPIVDRASAEMVATINDEVGKLLRAHVAAAIERDIEKRRKGTV